MRAPVRLGLYAAALVAVFAVALVAAGAVVPDQTVQAWAEETEGHVDAAREDHELNPSGGTGGETGAHTGHAAAAAGRTLAAKGYRLANVTAPGEPGARGELSLTVLDPQSRPVTDFELSHEKELHLIVVRTDGTGFRHVHPERDAQGRWSIPWQWDAAGSYRVYAEFVPAKTGKDTALSTLVPVAGDFTPSPWTGTTTTAEAGDYEISVEGRLSPGEASTLRARVTRNGEPVTTLEPYLGAYGHLVALREGDLAYLHVHPHRAEPAPRKTSGPEVAFEVTPPTPGRYLLYLDFQVNGQVHTARFVLETHASGDRQGEDIAEENGDGHDHDQ